MDIKEQARKRGSVMRFNASRHGCRGDGEVVVPERLTAENGAKAALMGEFRMGLPERDENGEEYVRQLNIPWTSIKEIYAAAINHFVRSASQKGESK